MKEHERFFSIYGATFFANAHGETCSVEEFYQQAKARLINELEVRFSQFLGVGILRDRGDCETGRESSK